jgi:hypothetical protein
MSAVISKIRRLFAIFLFTASPRLKEYRATRRVTYNSLSSSTAVTKNDAQRSQPPGVIDQNAALLLGAFCGQRQETGQAE